MRDWLYMILFVLFWLLSTADFSVEIGDKNQITIERSSDEPKKKEEPSELKGSW